MNIRFVFCSETNAYEIWISFSYEAFYHRLEIKRTIYYIIYIYFFCFLSFAKLCLFSLGSRTLTLGHQFLGFKNDILRLINKSLSNLRLINKNICVVERRPARLIRGVTQRANRSEAIVAFRSSNWLSKIQASLGCDSAVSLPGFFQILP